MKSISHIFVLTAIFLSLWGCDKLNLKWNLDKVPKTPIILSTGILAISNTGVTIEVEIQSDSSSEVLQRGVCLSTQASPDTNSIVSYQGSGDGIFVCVIDNLSPNTTYYIRSFAKNKVGLAYGEELSFTTTNISAALATINTNSPSSITSTSAELSSTITSTGGSNITTSGVCYGNIPNPSLLDYYTTDGTNSGTFVSALSNLSPNTLYYARAYATNGVGTAYGNQVQFTTSNNSAALATINTNSASSITSSSAVLSSTITSNGGSNIITSGVCYATTPNPNLLDFYTTDGTNVGTFVSSLTSLSSNTLYYVRAYATNGVGTAYGNQVQFTTSQTPAISIETFNCSTLAGINSLYHGMNGTSAPWGLSNNGYNGSCWSAPDPLNSGQLGTAIGQNHYVGFNRNFQNQGYFELWVNTYNPGYPNIVPSVYLNGVNIGSCTVIGGQSSSFYWLKVRSPLIQSGNNNIQISFDGSYYQFKIDEIEFFEY